MPKPAHTLVLALVCVLTACGDTGASCPRFDGVYLASYDELSGDCGALPADLDTYDPSDPAPAIPADCTVRHMDASEDGCDVESDVECPTTFTDGTRGTVRRVVSAHKDGAESAHGTLELRLAAGDGSRICRSVYDVAITRR